MYIPNARARRRATALFLLPSMIGLVMFCLVPMISSLVYAFMDYDLLAGSMKYIGIKNFKVRELFVLRKYFSFDHFYYSFYPLFS